MINPILALLLFGLLSAILGSLFWPRRGLYWRWERAYWKGELVDVEDALKHVYDCEYLNRTSTVESVAGSLSISNNRAVRVIGRLQELGLLEDRDGTLTLTPSGRGSALRVIRIHRLWERYLADRTGMEESRWHDLADRWEHTTTPEQVEALATRLGSPRFDPHGDPIPTAEGELPGATGQALPSLEVGQLARIVHVEDEPQAIYSQLVAQGLHPGMFVRVVESSSTRVRVVGDGEEFVLAPIVAANLAVEPVPKASAEEYREPPARLSDLELSESGTVVGISPACRGPQRSRLLDLGFVPGTAVKTELLSPSGDPIAYRVRGAVIALRSDQARLIFIAPGQEQGR